MISTSQVGSITGETTITVSPTARSRVFVFFNTTGIASASGWTSGAGLTTWKDFAGATTDSITFYDPTNAVAVQVTYPEGWVWHDLGDSSRWNVTGPLSLLSQVVTRPAIGITGLEYGYFSHIQWLLGCGGQYKECPVTWDQSIPGLTQLEQGTNGGVSRTWYNHYNNTGFSYNTPNYIYEDWTPGAWRVEEYVQSWVVKPPLTVYSINRQVQTALGTPVLLSGVAPTGAETPAFNQYSRGCTSLRLFRYTEEIPNYVSAGGFLDIAPEAVTATGMKVDRRGWIHIIYTQGTTVYHRVSKDGGRTVSMPETIVTGYNACLLELDESAGLLIVPVYKSATSTWHMVIASLDDDGSIDTVSAPVQFGATSLGYADIRRGKDGKYYFVHTTTNAGNVQLLRCRNLQSNGQGTWT